jgi:hypothetical protein
MLGAGPPVKVGSPRAAVYPLKGVRRILGLGFLWFASGPVQRPVRGPDPSGPLRIGPPLPGPARDRSGVRPVQPAGTGPVGPGPCPVRLGPPVPDRTGPDRSGRGPAADRSRSRDRTVRRRVRTASGTGPVRTGPGRTGPCRTGRTGPVRTGPEPDPDPLYWRYWDYAVRGHRTGPGTPSGGPWERNRSGPRSN